ncbi:MAG: molybdopterin molybdotransferase MoeA [Dehalococcoidia bacterium]|nr:MAG: molybdopterin molybdotransferase MoeA [Dehalococcoidia bacterium]
MISVDHALNKVINSVDILDDEDCAILNSIGQVLAEDIRADINVPQHDNSAMDGYALQSVDTRGASMQNVKLIRVIETVPAGYIAQNEVTPGTAIRIMTGAPMPKGADCIVKFEATDEFLREKPITEIGILGELKPGMNVRRAGEDIPKDSIALIKGTEIRPSEVGILASLGYSKVKVIRRPRIAILATGDEVTDINKPLLPGKIYNSNTYSLAALIKTYGAIPIILGISKDNEDSLIKKLRHGMDADILLTIGGINSGDYDLVKDVLAKQGDIQFCSVRMKPGKSLSFGTIEGINKAGLNRIVSHFGLPGNPVSCMVACELFVRPAVLKMMGKKDLFKSTIEAEIEDSKVNNGKVRTFARAKVNKKNGQYSAKLTSHQKSGMLISMSLANGLAIIPEDAKEVKAGDKVRVMMLD